jgi:hypothetical protein
MAIAHPNASYEFYKSILSVAANEWAMEMLFTDFMSDRANALDGAISSTYYEASHDWMEGMVKAASELDMETQVDGLS